MARKVTEYRIFIATPGGLDEERKAFRDTVREYNEIDALDREITFTPVGWEDTLGGVRRPQDVINDQLVRCDYFLLLLWDRWGSPTDKEASSGYSSGCEEEYELALGCLRDSDCYMREVAVFFKAADHRQLSDPGDQLKRVLSFKEGLEREKTVYFKTFDEVSAFRQLLLKYLAKWVRDHENDTDPTPTPSMPPPLASRPEMPASDETLNRAEELVEAGDLESAEGIFARAAAAGSLEAFDRYGNFLLRVGRLAQAEEMYLQVLISLAEGQEEWAARSYGTLGEIYHIKQDIARAEKMYLKAIELHLALGSLKGLSTLYSNLAVICEGRGEWEKAIDLRGKALEIASEASPIQFYSCFLSYSHADKVFARQLHDRLQDHGIRCWLDEHQLLPGDDIYETVDRGIRLWDKVLLCCSEASLTSWWVEEEIATAFAKEQQLKRERGVEALALIPLNLDGYLFTEWNSGKTSIVRSRLAADFTGWETDNEKYEVELKRLVFALRADTTGREIPPRSKL